MKIYIEKNTLNNKGEKQYEFIDSDSVEINGEKLSTILENNDKCINNQKDEIADLRKELGEVKRNLAKLIQVCLR